MKSQKRLKRKQIRKQSGLFKTKMPTEVQLPSLNTRSSKQLCECHHIVVLSYEQDGELKYYYIIPVLENYRIDFCKRDCLELDEAIDIFVDTHQEVRIKKYAHKDYPCAVILERDGRHHAFDIGSVPLLEGDTIIFQAFYRYIPPLKVEHIIQTSFDLYPVIEFIEQDHRFRYISLHKPYQIFMHNLVSKFMSKNMLLINNTLQFIKIHNKSDYFVKYYIANKNRPLPLYQKLINLSFLQQDLDEIICNVKMYDKKEPVNGDIRYEQINFNLQYSKEELLLANVAFDEVKALRKKIVHRVTTGLRTVRPPHPNPPTPAFPMQRLDHEHHCLENEVAKEDHDKNPENT